MGEGGREPGERAWGRIRRDEAFLIKRKYLCLHTIAIATWDDCENSGCLTAPLKKKKKAN